MDKIVCCTNLTLFGGSEIESEQYFVLCQGIIFNVFFLEEINDSKKKVLQFLKNLGHIFFFPVHLFSF